MFVCKNQSKLLCSTSAVLCYKFLIQLSAERNAGSNSSCLVRDATCMLLVLSFVGQNSPSVGGM